MSRLIIIFLGVVCGSFLLKAHPPREIKLELIPDTTLAVLTIEHKVEAPLNHFIEKIEIRLDKKLLKKWRFSKQENTEFQRVEFNLIDLRLRPGTKFDILAVCNKVGKLKKEFVL